MNNNMHHLNPPNVMPTIPTIPLPQIPAVPQIPPLSDGSIGSPDNNNNNNNNLPPQTPIHAVNINNIPPPATVATPNSNNNFQFQQVFTVSDLNNANHNNMINGNNMMQNPNNIASPGSTNSTFNSAGFNMNSPSTTSNTTPSNGANNNNNNNNNNIGTLRSPTSGNVVLSGNQYSHLCQQLDRLQNTQKEQKDTIHQLVSRLHSLERVIDNQRHIISQV